MRQWAPSNKHAICPSSHIIYPYSGMGRDGNREPVQGDNQFQTDRSFRTICLRVDQFLISMLVSFSATWELQDNVCVYVAGKLGSRRTVQWHIHTCISNLNVNSHVNFSCTFTVPSECFLQMFHLCFSGTPRWSLTLRLCEGRTVTVRCFSYLLWQELVNKHHNQQRKSHRHPSFRM